MIYNSGCPSGKVTYESEAEAKKTAALLRKQGTQLQVYRCQDCGLWHTASAPKKFKKPVRHARKRKAA